MLQKESNLFTKSTVTFFSWNNNEIRYFLGIVVIFCQGIGQVTPQYPTNKAKLIVKARITIIIIQYTKGFLRFLNRSGNVTGKCESLVEVTPRYFTSEDHGIGWPQIY
jgi:hypothetical protein